MSELQDFLRKKVESLSSQPRINWDQRRQWWLRKVEELYKEIKDWLTPLGDSVTVGSRQLRITEENIGEYLSEKLLIGVGDELVEIIPVGTIIIGSWGRVDIVGERGVLMLVLLEKSRYPSVSVSVSTMIDDANTDTEVCDDASLPNDSYWYLFDRESVRPKYVEFNEDSFAAALKRVMKNVEA